MKKVALVVATGLFFVVLFALLNPARRQTRGQQINEACEREFGSEGADAVAQCRIVTMTRELSDRQKAKLDRAAD